jgi:hypothetical protein
MEGPLIFDASFWTSRDYAGSIFKVGIFIPKLRVVIDPRHMSTGAPLPDLIDKPVGEVIFASTLANERIIGHTLLFVLLALIGIFFSP